MIRLTIRRHQRGSVLVYTAITCLALLGFLGLGLDTAREFMAAHELQNAADAAALAGAQYVQINASQARSAALAVAAANFAEGVSIQLADNPGNNSSGTIVLGVYDRTQGTFTPTLSSPNAVKITACRTAAQNGSLPLLFGPIFGASAGNVQRSAIAMVSGSSPGVIILDPSGSGALTDTATGGDFIVTNGTIDVNSSSSTAVTLIGGGSMIANSLNIVGAYHDTGSGSLPGTVNLGATAATDPYISLAAPALPPNGGQSGNTYSPGYYPLGIRISSANPSTFQPGIYYIDNGISFIGSGAVTGNNVLFYVNSGAFRLTGSGAVNLSPPSSGTWAGITIFQARTNASGSQLTGSGNFNIAGAIYVPDGTLTVAGSGQSFGNSLVVKDLLIVGSGTVNVPFGGGTVGSGTPFLVQ